METLHLYETNEAYFVFSQINMKPFKSLQKSSTDYVYCICVHGLNGNMERKTDPRLFMDFKKHLRFDLRVHLNKLCKAIIILIAIGKWQMHMHIHDVGIIPHQNQSRRHENTSQKLLNKKQTNKNENKKTTGTSQISIVYGILILFFYWFWYKKIKFIFLSIRNPISKDPN